MLSGFTSSVSSVACAQNSQGLFLTVGSEDHSVCYFQVKINEVSQKIEIQLLWGSSQNALNLSDAKFEGALLSSRNTALVKQRGV